MLAWQWPALQAVLQGALGTLRLCNVHAHVALEGLVLTCQPAEQKQEALKACCDTRREEGCSGVLAMLWPQPSLMSEV